MPISLGYLGYICEILHLNTHNHTMLDLCKDTPFNPSTSLHKLYRDKSKTTKLNGKRVINRDEDRPEILRALSGSLNKDKYQTIYVKQRNAIKDKKTGVLLRTYDKAAEKTIKCQQYSIKITSIRTEVHQYCLKGWQYVYFCR